jgi:hypothetical protein
MKPLLAAGAFAGAIGVLASGAAERPADRAADARNVSAISDLKPGPGRELTMAYCLPCHSAAVMTATHQTRQGWDETITKMQTRNGLWPIPADMRNRILDYLAATQPPSDPGLAPAKETPWAGPLYRPNPLW